MDLFDLLEGLDTDVGCGGLPLSTGELQLLSIARVLVRHPRVLLMVCFFLGPCALGIRLR